MSYVTITYDEAFPAAMRADWKAHARGVAARSRPALDNPVIEPAPIIPSKIKLPVEIARPARRISRRCYRVPLRIPRTPLEMEYLLDMPAEVPHFLVSDIQAAVASAYFISMIDMRSARRTADYVRPRHVAMWLSKKLTVKSLPALGRAFGGRDHTTILHGVRKIEALYSDGRLALPPGLEMYMAAVADGKPRKSGFDLLPRETRE